MTTPPSTALQQSPLHDRHVELGAKLADFGGWLMPIEYTASGGGVLKEHAAVRERVGVFDVSHLGKATVRGPGASDFVNACLSNDLGRIAPGKAQYTLCCDRTGGVVDDLIAYLVSPDEVFLVPNAANADEVVRLLADAAAKGGHELTIVNQHRDFGVLAVQGPLAGDVLAALDLPAPTDYMAYVDTTWNGGPVRICRTGYTGEHGYEIVPAWDLTPALWDALEAEVRKVGGMPAGLGARDTLRTEMGYPLHGQDLTLSITPVQAGSGWAVGWQKDRFWGRDALVEERAGGPARRLRGVLSLDRGIPRPHMSVLDADGNLVGEVTSGTFSPSLRQGIGLALLDSAAGVEDGAELFLDVRGRRSAVRVTKPPFVESHVR